MDTLFLKLFNLSLIPSAQPIPADIVYQAAPAIDSGIPVVNQVVNPVISNTFAPAPAASVNPLQVVTAVAAWVWLAGLILMLGYALVSYLLLRRRVATATLLRENIKQSERVDSPFVLGLLRPTIYLPYAMDEADMGHVIAHERAHIHRGDHWWKPLGFLILAVYWFNPLVWVAYILFCRDMERACDEKVAANLAHEERQAYSTALLHCGVRRRTVAACPLAFGEVGVKSRVKSVMHYKKPAFWVVFIALAACIVVAVCFLTVPEKPDDNDQPTTITKPEEDALRQKYPEYFDLNPAKGLEVCVWKTAENTYRCGVLPGTNHDKTDEEISRLSANGATIEEMKLILSSYDISDDMMILIPYSSSNSSHFLPLDDADIRAINTSFGYHAAEPVEDTPEPEPTPGIPAPKGGADPYADLEPVERAAAFLKNADTMSYETPLLMYGEYVMITMEYKPRTEQLTDPSSGTTFTHTFDHTKLILEALQKVDLTSLRQMEPAEIESFDIQVSSSGLLHVGDARCRATVWYDQRPALDQEYTAALVFTFSDGTVCAFEERISGTGVAADLAYAISIAGNATSYALFPQGGDVTVVQLSTGKTGGTSAYGAAWITCVFENTPRLAPRADDHSGQFDYQVTLADGSIYLFDDENLLLQTADGQIYPIGGFEEGEGTLTIETLIRGLITGGFKES